MKVLFIAGREPAYVRNDNILKGLKKNEVEVVECVSSAPSYFLRYPIVLVKFLFKRDYDVVFVGFLGQPLVPLIKRLTNKPIIFDAYLSVYDTMVFDRKHIRPGTVIANLFFNLDKRSCELADVVLLDTNAHIDYFCREFGLDRDKFIRVFVGADEDVFYPRKAPKREGFLVFYYGSFLPLQGIEYIVEAAKLLESHPDIKFKIIGKGILSSKIKAKAKKLNVKNVEFVDWVPYEKLPEEIAKADVCLAGHFSNSDKAQRVIPTKAFQMIAMEKPVIMGNNPAAKELFENRKNALMVEMANSKALANAILELKNNDFLREEIGEGGYKIFKEKCTTKRIGREIKNIIENPLEEKR